MKRKLGILTRIGVVFFVCFLISLPGGLIASEELEEKAERLKQIQDEKAKIEAQLEEARDRERGLTEQIAYMDNQMRVTELNIAEHKERLVQLGEEIETLTGKINKLEKSLDELSSILLKRIEETYKARTISPLSFLFSSSDFSNLVMRAKYLQVAQAHDKKIMTDMEFTKSDYSDQKTVLEEKKEEVERLKEELEGYRATLDKQKADKEYLLEVTKNDEVRFEQLLAELEAEQRAIEGIIAELLRFGLPDGKEVNRGDVIGIQGNTGFSTGPHVHFEIREKHGDSWLHVNPRNYLDDGRFRWCLDDYYITQEYGPADWTPMYSFHTGIDIATDGDPSVRAADNGKVSYYGNPGGYGNYALVVHNDELISIYGHLR